MKIREAAPGDGDVRRAFLTRWNALYNARKGVLEPGMDHPALVAEDDGRLIGVLTYVIIDDQCEVLTLHVDDQRRGVGTALLSEIADIARRAGCRRLWLITTNDNVDALRFYQRRGLRLAALYAGAVDESRRTLKPEIPTVGMYGIPLRDEIELELDLT